MHIPNGYLGPQVCAGAAALAGTCFAVAASRVSTQLHLPAPRVAAATAAAIFAAQAVNFPVSGGTSGHLLGATLAVLIAGPAAAIWILATVLTVQCFLFGDGGTHALGANLLNIAFIAPLTGHWIGQRLQRRAVCAEGQLLAIGVAAWVSVMAAATAASFELALAGTVPISVVLPAMLLAHAKIGIGEMLVTTAAAFLLFDLLPGKDSHSYRLVMPRFTSRLLGGLMLMTGLSVVLAPFASTYPDGLQYVAGKLGFHSLETGAAFAPFAPQQWPIFGAGAIAIATLLGVATVTVAAWLISHVAQPARR